MGMLDGVLRFIGSKWFVFILGLTLIGTLPFTYHNFTVVYEKGQMSQFWWIVAVFIINIISIGLCVYKFMSLIGKPKPGASQPW